jgi:hypothetical protein
VSSLQQVGWFSFGAGRLVLKKLFFYIKFPGFDFLSVGRGALSTTTCFDQPFLLHLITLGKINVQLFNYLTATP